MKKNQHDEPKLGEGMSSEQLEEWRTKHREGKADAEKAEQLKKEITKEVESETGLQLDAFQIGPQSHPANSELDETCRREQERIDSIRARMLNPGKK